MDKWTLQNIIWNEEHGEYHVNDLIISAVLSHRSMQKTAQTAPASAPAVGPTIAPTNFSSVAATAVGREFQRALDMFRMSIMKSPGMKRFQVWLEGILRAIDANRWERPLPNAIMGVPQMEQVNKAMTSSEDVEYPPAFAGLETRGTPQEMWDLKLKSQQDRATNVLNLMSLFTNAVNTALGRRF